MILQYNKLSRHNFRLCNIIKLNENLYCKKQSTCCNVVQNRIEKCCVVHIVQGCEQHCATLLHPIQPQQYCSILLKTMRNVGSTTLLNPVILKAQNV